MKQNGPIVAIMYDFDKTLSPRDMQEYGFIPEIGMTPKAFWDECNDTMRRHNMDQILAYMWVMLTASRGKMLLNREEFKKLGRDVQLFPGVSTWFSRVNDYAARAGITVEHYVISSGLKEIMEGTAIAGEFKEIYAAEYCYDSDDVPVWPAMAVSYTGKTQFLYRINKDVPEVTDNTELNEYMPEEQRRIPFRNMIYLGDGFTDVPCMKLVKGNGGHSIVVYQQESRATAEKLLLEGRADFAQPADYSKGEPLEQTVFDILDQMAANHKIYLRQTTCRAQAEQNRHDRGI